MSKLHDLFSPLLLLLLLGPILALALSDPNVLNLCSQFRVLPEHRFCGCIDGAVLCFRVEEQIRSGSNGTIWDIDCGGKSLLPNLTVPSGMACRELRIYNCPVNATLKDTFDRIGVRDVRSLHFDGGTTRYEDRRGSAENITISDGDLLPDSELLEEFNLQNSEISAISNDFLSNRPFLAELFLANNAYLSALPEAFAIRSLRKLHLQNNNISSITSKVFSELESLEVLDLKGNPIRRLAEDAFRNNQALLSLHLRFDDEQLPENVFAPLEALTELRIVGGRLRFVQEQLFRNQRRLGELDLSGNQLALLEGPVFGSLNALEHLKLANNQLQSVALEIFPDPSRLASLNLNGNKLTDIPSSPGYISPFDRLHNLQKLSLESNQLSEIGSWANKSSLKALKMGKNLLTRLDISAIPATLRDLDLSYNFLEQIDVSDETCFSRTIQLRLTLTGNQLRYDCRILNFLRLLRVQRDLQVIPWDAGLNERKLYCELKQPLCPKECHSCRLFGPQRELNLNCSNRALEVIPQIPPELHLNASSVVLDVGYNSIRLFPTLQSNPGFGLVNYLLMDNNLVESLSVANLHDNLTWISLQNNSLHSLDMKLVDAIMALPKLTELDVQYNRWPCHCALAKRMFLLQSKIKNFHNLTCGDFGQPVVSIELSCELYMIALISISFLTLMVIAVGFAIFYRYQNEIKIWLYTNHLCLSCVSNIEADCHLQYDAFISYSHHDEDFIAQELVPVLEAAPQKYQLCIHVRDFLVGLSIESEIIQAIAKSCRTIVFVTRHFLQSEWTRHEFRLAFEQSLRDNRKRLIVILATDVGNRLDELDPQLRVFFSTTTYLRQDDPSFWPKLLYAMPHRDKLATRMERKMYKKECRSRNLSLREINVKRQQKDIADVEL